MQLQTRAVGCLCLHLPQPRPQAPYASVLLLTMSVLCDLRYRCSIALCRRQGQGERDSARFGARPVEGARLGRAAGHRRPRTSKARWCQPCAVRVQSRERRGPRMSVWTRYHGTDAGFRGACSPDSAIVALDAHVSVPRLVVHGCDVPPGPFGLPVWTKGLGGSESHLP